MPAMSLYVGSVPLRYPALAHSFLGPRNWVRGPSTALRFDLHEEVLVLSSTTELLRTVSVICGP